MTHEVTHEDLGPITREDFGLASKDTNPKDGVGSRKVSLSNVPLPPLLELALAMQEGAIKYGRHNYRTAGVRESVYFDACVRHLFAWWEGENLDPDSNLPHITKAMACLVVLRDAQISGNSTDDRPKPSPVGWIATLNKLQEGLLYEKTP